MSEVLKLTPEQSELMQRREDRNLPRVIQMLASYYEDLGKDGSEEKHSRGIATPQKSTPTPSIIDKQLSLRATLRPRNNTTTVAPWLFVQQLDKDGYATGSERIFGFSPNLTDEVTEEIPATRELVTHLDTEIDPETGRDYGHMTDLFVRIGRTLIDDSPKHADTDISALKYRLK